MQGNGKRSFDKLLMPLSYSFMLIEDYKKQEEVRS